ncbi:MAG: NAD-binding protein, partial [Deltaproteobacteria bacterium]|nr:NAD-binding protein [Deltaproteobacteria bacterium]
DWSMVGSQVGNSLIFSLFVLVGNPLIVMIIMGIMGYRRRTGFLAGLTVAQISEFSLIVAALGLSIGHINKEIMGLITLVGVVTIFLSTYMILYSYSLYRILSGPLRIFERRTPYREVGLDSGAGHEKVDIILVGMGRFGSGLAEHLIRRGHTILGVDYDPNVLDTWNKRGVHMIYSDMADPEIHDLLPLSRAGWVISTVRSKEASLALLNALKRNGYTGKVALSAADENERSALEKAGAHLIFCPFRDATEQAADALTYAMEFLPENVDWPVSFMEVRIRSDSSAAGKNLIEIPLSGLGVTILAVSRGGRVNYEPQPDFRIFPGDRLLIMGSPVGMKEVEMLLNHPEIKNGEAENDRFEIAEIMLSDNSGLSGKTVAELQFRQKFGVTLVGIRRGDEQITMVNPTEPLKGGDCLIVIGKTAAVKDLKNRMPL